MPATANVVGEEQARLNRAVHVSVPAARIIALLTRVQLAAQFRLLLVLNKHTVAHHQAL